MRLLELCKERTSTKVTKGSQRDTKEDGGGWMFRR